MSQPTRVEEQERLQAIPEHRHNLIAAAIMASRTPWIPLSVRYAAARAADDLVQTWVDGTWKSPLEDAE